jgi:HPt (histidine-containing phosphotransfer) domain-containing protein
VNSCGENGSFIENDGKCEPRRAIERLGNMPSLYAEVVARFMDDTAGNFAKLHGAIQAGDLRLTQQTAHSLKGLAAMCGAVGVESLLGEIEAAGRDADADLVADCSQRLEPAMNATREILAPYRQSSQITAGGGK